MRHLLIAAVASLALFASACGGSEDPPSPEGTSGGGGYSGNGNLGGASGRGGSSASIAFSDLPGKIRFINFVADGTTGVDLDVYWGISRARSEKMATLTYGEVSEFMTPRRADEVELRANEARYFVVPAGEVFSGSRQPYLIQSTDTFTADTVLTVGMAAVENVSGATLSVSIQTMNEAKLSTPPAGMAHVFAWATAFDQIVDGHFVLVGTDELCSPEQGAPGDANLGVPALIPEGRTSLSLFDANTEPPCDSGATPVTASVEAGHSYVLLGEAETYELKARRSVLLEVGAAN